MPLLTQSEAASELLRRREARRSLSAFHQYFRPFNQIAKFQKEICEALESVEAGRIKRLIIEIPPRHTKSTFASIDFPSWYVGRNPDKQIIAASYGTSLAREFGRSVRNMLAMPEFAAIFPGIGLRADSKAADRWHTNKGGVYVAASINGPITGRGAHVALIDDPHKDFGEGNNPTLTQSVWDWYRQVLYTRLMKGAAIIIIAQRMSDHDLTSRVLADAKNKGEKWTVIKMPALTDKDGNSIKYEGDVEEFRAKAKKGVALWPEFYSVDSLIDTALTVGPSEFNAMYQQEPDVLKGKVIQLNWIHHWAKRGMPLDGRVLLPETFDTVIQSWDMALKGSTTSSFVVGQIWGFKGPYDFLLDQARGQWGFDETINSVLSLSSRWPNARTKLFEDKANGPAAEDRLKKRLSGILLVSPLGGDKTARMMATQSEWASGHVLLPPPESHSWANAWVQRILKFPAEPNDEGDAASQALNWRAMKRNLLDALSKE